MGERTAISWTDATWNPTTGCTKVSEGCKHCYAEALSLRMGWSKHPWTPEHAAENFVLHPDRLRMPYRWKEPRRVFVNSMSDLFHELMPEDFLAQVFAVMNDLPQHTFQILTKRPEIAAAWPGPWGPNIWMGTSVENQRMADVRIPHLVQTPAAVRFLSCEPLLGPIDLTRVVVREGLTGWGPRRREHDALIGWQHDFPAGASRPRESMSGRGRVNWVIVGGESGPHYRPMDHAWARSIRDQCVAASVPFFFKQSAAPRTEMGTSLIEEDGSRRQWHQYPGDLAPPVRIAAGMGWPSGKGWPSLTSQAKREGSLSTRSRQEGGDA